MRRATASVFAIALAVPVLGSVPASGASSTLVVNEIDYDQPSTDASEFVEIKNVSAAPVGLSGYSLRLVNGTGGGASIYQTVPLPSITLGAGDYFVVCANAATVANCDLDVTPDTNLIQNGNPDAVAIILDGAVVDTVSYGGNTGAPYTEGSGATTDDPAQVDLGISRFPDGTDIDQNSIDLSRRCITPGAMNAVFSSACGPVVTGLRIHDIQGAQHRSPYEGTLVSGVPGVVTARRSNGFYFQDPEPDADPETSEGLFVFTGAAPTATVGQAVLVSGRVTEFRPGGTASANLTTTELTVPTVIPAGPGATIPTTIVGLGGRVPPHQVIDDDAAGDVETSGSFDAATDGIDFYESLEATLLQVNRPVVVGPRNNFGEVWVLADNGAGAGVRTSRGGIVIRPTDFNPERIQLEDDIVPGATPNVNVRDSFTSPAIGVLDYNFGNFEVQLTSALTRVNGGLQRETTRAQRGGQMAMASFNVENLDPTDTPQKFAALAGLIVNNLRAPDLIAIQEIQDNDGPLSPAPTDASVTWNLLIAAIRAAGGPLYEYRQIDPLPNMDGGEPNGNIRQGFLFRTDRGLSFVDRPGGTAMTATHDDPAQRGAQLTFSPGRIDPTNPAFNTSRKPLAGEFRWRGRTFFAIANHFNSKGGDDPLFGRFQPPRRPTEVQRHQQAAVVNAFVDELLAADRRARIAVLGDINDFEFSETVAILKGGVLANLMDTLPRPERYSYVFEGNSQVLDQILVSFRLFRDFGAYDSVHVNSEFFDQDSDHEPQVARFFGGGGGGDDDDDDDDDDDH